MINNKTHFNEEISEGVRKKGGEPGCATLHRHKQEMEQLWIDNLPPKRAHPHQAQSLTPAKHKNHVQEFSLLIPPLK